MLWASANSLGFFTSKPSQALLGRQEGTFFVNLIISLEPEFLHFTRRKTATVCFLHNVLRCVDLLSCKRRGRSVRLFGCRGIQAQLIISIPP